MQSQLLEPKEDKKPQEINKQETDHLQEERAYNGIQSCLLGDLIEKHYLLAKGFYLLLHRHQYFLFVSELI